MFNLDYQPFRIVEDTGFQSFVQALNPNYELPSRHIIANTTLAGMYEECLLTVKEIFKELSSNICLTTDCWTSRNNESFVAITVHFFSTNFEIQSALLSCNVFYEKHTSENLARELLTVTKEWGLERKIILAVSENASNIKGAIAITGWKFLRCYAHTLDLIVLGALKTKEVKIILEKVKIIVAHFKRSSKATIKLIDPQKNVGIPNPKKVIQDVVTQWNSTCFML